jgi:hypothetical protein
MNDLAFCCGFPHNDDWFGALTVGYENLIFFWHEDREIGKKN